MNANNELLEHIYKDAVMGINSMTDLSKVLKTKDNKIKGDVEDILKGYEKFVNLSEKEMKKIKKI